MMRVAFLLGAAVMAGQAPRPAATAFEHSAFCRHEGCVRQASWKRFGKAYTVYRIETDSKVEVAIYRDTMGNPLGATYSTWTDDDWSADYGRAVTFLGGVFPGIPVTTNVVRELDHSKTQAGRDVKWREERIVLVREYERQPSFNLFVRVKLEAGVWRPGQP